MRNTPSRISPETYPIAATATAPAYDYGVESSAVNREQGHDNGGTVAVAQQALFAAPVTDARVIPFDALTSATQRDRIRARAAEIPRPAPLKAERIEAPRGRAKAVAKSRPTEQRHLDFLGQQPAHPESNIICDAPIAPPGLRVRAALVDAILMATGCAVAASLFKLFGGPDSIDRHIAPFLLLAVATVPFAYKLLWAFAGRDTVGMRTAGLQLVDFDGNPPSQARRYQRLLGTLLSFLAVGLGLIWVLVDEDGLTWHDHISSTFPTIVSED
jgi:uncharacterized RDD family membrane protein YckC